jgi:acetyl-CoA carboxylase biotin carboxyl carrier protein
MNLDDLKRILDLVRDHELAEFELEHEGLRLKIRKDSATGAITAQAPHGTFTMAAPPPGGMLPAAPAPIQSSGAAAETAADGAGEAEIELAVVKSPIVGTFYRASEPNSPPFVEIGSSVKKGQVLCIIEAMKLMNEIDSEYDGEVVNVYVENGQAVQYGERLFAIRSH